MEKIQSVVSRVSRDTTAQAGPGPAAAFPPEPYGLFEYWQILGRHRNLILALALLSALAGFLISLPQKPLYRASTTIEIQGLNENFLNMRDVDPTAATAAFSPESYLETQVKILESESLADRVVARQRLHERPEFAKPGRDWSGLERWLGLPVARPLTPNQQARKRVQDSLKVKQSRTHRIVEVSTDAPDPNVAAELANALAEEFIQQNVEVRWNAAQRTGQWLANQLGDVKTRLVESEEKLQAYARANDLLFTSEKDSVAEVRLRQVQEELSRAQADRVLRQSRWEQAANAPAESLPEVLDSNTLRDYQTRLTDLRRQLAELRPQYKPAHYKVQRLEAQVGELEKALEKEQANILNRIGNEYQSAVRREDLLARAYETQAGQVSGEAARSIQYNTLKREVDTNRQLYDSMLHKVKEAGIASAIRASNIRVVDPASPPPAPYRPNAGLNAGLGLLGGLSFGVAVAVARDRADQRRRFADRSIKSPGDSPVYLRVPELGVIPCDSVDRLEQGRRWLPGPAPARQLTVDLRPDLNDGVELATSLAKPSMVAESFRAALTSILFSAAGNGNPRILVVTSPAPGEGKTTTVSNLGIALAEISGRVLIVDGDMRRPRIHSVFGLSNQRGLADLLRDETPMEHYPPQALGLETRIPGLYVLPSGQAGRSISHLLHSDRLPQLLSRLRHHFGMILIDTPPMLQISDARVLARAADSVILVLRAGQTTHDSALAARQRFAEDSAPVLGTILNNWDPSTDDRYPSGYYYNYFYGSPEAA